MSPTAIAPEPDPRPTATAPVGATLPPGVKVRVCHEGLRGYKARRDALYLAAQAEPAPAECADA